MSDSFKKKHTPKEAKQKIAKYCSYQERCHQEVREKLYTYVLEPDDVEQIIVDLIQHDFLNEERFAVAFVRGKFLYKKWGRNKIKQELKRRKISEYCIKKGLMHIDDEAYMVALTTILQKKIDGQKGIKNYQKNYKAAQFALSKGYESDLIWDAIKTKFDA